MEHQCCPLCQASVQEIDRSCRTCHTQLIVGNSYRLIELIALGGQSKVYKAQRLIGEDELAIKVVPVQHLAALSHEAQILANHWRNLPFIPPFEAFWEEGGQGYLAMGFIAGQPLNKWAPQSEAELIGALRTLLGYLAQLHRAGQVHRDLKPANLLRLNDPDVDHTFAIVDFANINGLTIRFAAPEQLQGKEADPSSDIYSLATTICALLGLSWGEGETPGRALSTRLDLRENFRFTLSQMLLEERERRIPNAQVAFNLLNSAPLPEPHNVPGRVRLGEGHVTALSWIADTGGQQLAVGTTLGVRVYSCNPGKLEPTLNLETPGPVAQLCHAQAMDLLVVRIDAEKPLLLCRGRDVQQHFPGFPRTPTAVQLSPDGALMAATADDGFGIWRVEDGAPIEGPGLALADPGALIAFAGDKSQSYAIVSNGEVRIWHGDEERPFFVHKHCSSLIDQLVFAPDAATLALVDAEMVTALCLATGEIVVHEYLSGRRLNHLCFSPDGRVLALVLDGVARLWALEQSKSSRLPLEQTPGAIREVVFGPPPSSKENRPQRIALLGERTAWLARLDRLDAALLSIDLPAPMVDAAFNPGGQLIALASEARVSVHRVRDGVLFAPPLTEYMEAMHLVALSPDGTTLAALGASLRLWRFGKGVPQPLALEVGSPEPRLGLAFSPAQPELAVATSERLMRWRVDDSLTLLEAQSTVNMQSRSLVYTEGSELIHVGDGAIEHWATTGDSLVQNKLSRIGDEAVFLAKNGQVAASFSIIDGAVRVWRLEDNCTLWTLDDELRAQAGDALPLQSIALSDDGRQLATLSQEQTQIWAVGHDTPRATLRRGVHRAAFAPGDELLALINQEGRDIWLWRLYDKDISVIFRGHTREVSDIAFSQDGRTLVSAGWDGTVRLWTIQLGEHDDDEAG